MYLINYNKSEPYYSPKEEKIIKGNIKPSHDSHVANQSAINWSKRWTIDSDSDSDVHFKQETNKSSKNYIRKIHTVTYASHGGRDDRFCRAIESSIRNNYDIVILGWGVPWKGLSQKLEAAYNYASSIPADDIILFTDAFDVLFAKNASEIHFDDNNGKYDILFSAECGCWPHIIENNGFACFNSYPKSPTPYRYLNSGTWIGKAKQSAIMLQKVMNEAGKDFQNANDQKLVADMFISNRYGIALDYYNSIFQAMHMTLDAPLPRCNPKEDLELIKSNAILENGQHAVEYYNKRTKSTPAVFHFNGGGKRYHLEMENMMWYKKSEFNTPSYISWLKNYMLNVPSQKSGKMKFDDLCKNYVK
eukprot:gene12439-16684_t